MHTHTTRTPLCVAPPTLTRPYIHTYVHVSSGVPVNVCSSKAHTQAQLTAPYHTVHHAQAHTHMREGEEGRKGRCVYSVVPQCRRKRHALVLQTTTPAGRGKLLLGDGGYYEGSFVNGEMSGHGHRVFGLSGASYSGQFWRGEMWGRGLLCSRDGTQYEGEFVANRKEGEGCGQGGGGWRVWPRGWRVKGVAKGVEGEGCGRREGG